VLGGQRTHGFFQGAALGGGGQAAIFLWRHAEHFDTPFLGHDAELSVALFGRHGKRLAALRPVPANAGIGEEAGEIEGFEVAGDFFALSGSHDVLDALQIVLEKRNKVVQLNTSDENGRHWTTWPHRGPRRSFCFGRSTRPERPAWIRCPYG